jgi:predicted Zn-dependent peptidase
MPDLTITKTGGNIYLREDVFETISISGFLGPDIASEDIIAATAAGSILNNLLEDNLINKSKLLYNVSAYLDASIGASALYIESSYETKNMDAAQKGIRDTIENIIANGISQKDLDRVKIALKTNIEVARQYQASIAYSAGFFTLFGRQDLADTNVYLSKMEKLSRADIADFFKKYYSSASWTNVIMRKGAK